MPTTKFCPTCQLDKPFDPTADRKSRESGFFSLYACWDCHDARRREAGAKCKAKEMLEDLEGFKARHNEASARAKAKQKLADLEDFNARNREASAKTRVEYDAIHGAGAFTRRHAARASDTEFKRFKNRMRVATRRAFKKLGMGKPCHTEELMGCSWAEARYHFEKKFELGMSWENMHLIDIDHDMPLDYAKDERDAIALNHISNLKPMWKSDNRSKGAKHCKVAAKAFVDKIMALK